MQPRSQSWPMILVQPDVAGHDKAHRQRGQPFEHGQQAGQLTAEEFARLVRRHGERVVHDFIARGGGVPRLGDNTGCDGPMDLEQREGRVHRYKGHAIRRNLAATYGLASLREIKGWHDPWEALFARAAADRPPGASELVPCWLFEPGGHAVERRVPLIPLSREVAQYQRLKRMLAVYRLAFGQPRQEDLLCYLAARSDTHVQGGDELRLKLTPGERAHTMTTRRPPVAPPVVNHVAE